MRERDIIANALANLADSQDAYEADADVVLSDLEAAGYIIVPKEPTRRMLNAAIDTDSYKLGDISPLGFRCTPQQMFSNAYRAMLTAAKETT